LKTVTKKPGEAVLFQIHNDNGLFSPKKDFESGQEEVNGCLYKNIM
jgi:hypothetical protein